MSVVVATYPMSDNAVRNFSFEQFFDIFKTSQLDISHFWLINSGFDNEGVKKVRELRSPTTPPMHSVHYLTNVSFICSTPILLFEDVPYVLYLAPISFLFLRSPR